MEIPALGDDSSAAADSSAPDTSSAPAESSAADSSAESGTPSTGDAGKAVLWVLTAVLGLCGCDGCHPQPQGVSAFEA